MVSVGIVSRRRNTQKTICWFLPKCVLASNVCLGFGFLCCLVLWLVFCLGFYFFLQSSSYCFSRGHSLRIPVLQTSVSAIEMPVKGEVRKSYARHSNKNCQKCCTTEDHCVHLPGALWKMVLNVCCICACVNTQNEQGGNLSLLTS